MQRTDDSIRTGVIEYIKKQYNSEPEYLWERYPNYAVFRHKENRKWFAVVMDVQRSKLGLVGEGREWIVNVKIADQIFHDSLVCQDGFLPGYHMNKAAWVSVLLDGTVAMEMVCGLIEESFEATDAR